MLRWLWDLLFTCSQWTIIGKETVASDDPNFIMGYRYTLQDQWGNIKTKTTY